MNAISRFNLNHPLLFRNLLLCHAMQRAEPKHQIDCVDSDYLRSGKHFASVCRATRSFGSLNVGTSTSQFAM